MFKNKPVQGTGAERSAGYHGYWITDFTQIDPHLGTNAELKELIDDAHARGHQGLLRHHHEPHRRRHRYTQGQYSYLDQGDEARTRMPTASPFDDRDYAGTGTFPTMDAARSFPYTPVVPRRRENVKVPALAERPDAVPQPRRLDLHRRDRTTMVTSSDSTTCSPSTRRCETD